MKPDVQLSQAFVICWKQDDGDRPYHEFLEWCLTKHKPPIIWMRMGGCGPTGGSHVFHAEDEPAVRAYFAEHKIEFTEFGRDGVIEPCV